MSSYPVPLVPKQVEPALQIGTMMALGIIALSNGNLQPLPTSEQYSLVRIGWQQRGQPAFLITDDVTFIRVIEEDDLYNRQRDFKYFPDQSDPTSVVELTTYTRVWGVFWTVYGPSSFDNARKIRSSLYTQAFHDFYAGLNLYMVMDVAAPRRVPELRGGQWWERVDFYARFNEQVTEAPTVGVVQSTEVIIENAEGIQKDITIT